MENRDEREKDRLEFLQSYDFMKLGQAINHRNWQAAAMTVQRMQSRIQALGLDVFERQFTGIRQCILHKQERQAKDILALVMARRAQMLKAQAEKLKWCAKGSAEVDKNRDERDERN